MKNFDQDKMITKFLLVLMGAFILSTTCIADDHADIGNIPRGSVITIDLNHLVNAQEASYDFGGTVTVSEADNNSSVSISCVMQFDQAPKDRLMLGALQMVIDSVDFTWPPGNPPYTNFHFSQVNFNGNPLKKFYFTCYPSFTVGEFRSYLKNIHGELSVSPPVPFP